MPTGVARRTVKLSPVLCLKAKQPMRFLAIKYSPFFLTYQANSNKYLNGILAQVRLKEETSNAQVRWRIVDLV